MNISPIHSLKLPTYMLTMTPSVALMSIFIKTAVVTIIINSGARLKPIDGFLYARTGYSYYTTGLFKLMLTISWNTF